MFRDPQSLGYRDRALSCGISGFRALATSSAGFAFSRGLPDAGVSRDAVLGHIAEIVAATDLPVNADFESGYANDPEGVARNVSSVRGDGRRGIIHRRFHGRSRQAVVDLPVAVERMKAARGAIGASGVLLVGRAECFLVKHARAIERIDPALAGLCGRGRGRAIRARSSGAGGYPSDRLGGESQARERANEREHRAQGIRSGGAGSSADQRGEFTRAGGMGRIHPGGEGDRRRRKLRGLRWCGSVR